MRKMRDDGGEPVKFYLHLRDVFGAGRPRPRPALSPDAENQPFTAGRDPRGLGDTLRQLTDQQGWGSSLAASDVLLAWPEVAGADIASHSEPVSVEDGLLTVRCDSTAWATQLRIMRTDILTSIALRFPDAKVAGIRFQGPDVPSWKRGIRSSPGRGPRDTYG